LAGFEAERGHRGNKADHSRIVIISTIGGLKGEAIGKESEKNLAPFSMGLRRR